MAIVVQLSAPAGLRWKTTLAALASVVAVRVTVPESWPPGSAKVSELTDETVTVIGSPV